MRKATIVILAVATTILMVGFIIFCINEIAHEKGFSDGQKEAESECVAILPSETEFTIEPRILEPIIIPLESTVLEIRTVEENKPRITDDDVYCLAAAIYQEAGANYCSDDLRRMVADVILNRVEDERFPNTICEVLEDAPNGCRQYGSYSVTGVKFPKCTDEEAEKRAYIIAEDVLCGNHSELYGNGYVWQANFVQGNDGFWKEGVYFAK